MTAPIHSNVSVRTQRRVRAGLLPPWLLVAGAVALAGVSIDLFRGSPANAVAAPTAQVPASSVPQMDHSVVAALADEQQPEPGSSIAAYDSPASENPATATAAAVPPTMADDTLEPGASIAAYER